MDYNTLSQCKENDLRKWSQQLADHFLHLHYLKKKERPCEQEIKPTSHNFGNTG